MYASWTSLPPSISSNAVPAATEAMPEGSAGFFLTASSFSAFALRYEATPVCFAYIRFSLFTDCRTSCSLPCLPCVSLSPYLPCAVLPSYLPCVAAPLLLPCSVEPFLPCAVPFPFLSCTVPPPFLPLYSMPSAAVFACTVFLLSITWTELLFNFIFPSAATLFSATLPAIFGPCCTVRIFLPFIFASGAPFTWTLGFSFVWITIGLSSTFLMFNLHHLRFRAKKQHLNHMA